MRRPIAKAQTRPVARPNTTSSAPCLQIMASTSVAALSAESHANADFGGTTADAVRHHAIHADNCQDESEKPEGAGNDGAGLVEQETVAAVEQPQHRANSEDGHRWRDGVDLIDRDADYRVGRHRAANLQRRGGNEVLAERNVEAILERTRDLIEASISRDANDLNGALRVRRAREGFPDGILIRPIFGGHRRIYNRDGNRWKFSVSAVGQLATLKQRDAR